MFSFLLYIGHGRQQLFSLLLQSWTCIVWNELLASSHHHVSLYLAGRKKYKPSKSILHVLETNILNTSLFLDSENKCLFHSFFNFIFLYFTNFSFNFCYLLILHPPLNPVVFFLEQLSFKVCFGSKIMLQCKIVLKILFIMHMKRLYTTYVCPLLFFFFSTFFDTLLSMKKLWQPSNRE